MQDFGLRIPMDPRVIRKVQSDPRMRREQAPDWLSEWGGPSGYAFWAKQPPTQRQTYFAIVGGHATSSEIAVATGLPEAEVNKAISELEKKGHIERGEVSK